MTPVHDQILEILLRYISRMNAEGVLRRAAAETGLDLERLSASDMPRLLPKLERRAWLFVDPAQQGRLSAELAQIDGERPSRKLRVVSIRTESDISDARRMAKAICEGLGAKSFIVNKVVTIVSELARNIVHYTSGGTIELGVLRDKPIRILVVAADDGAGIPNLEEILSGRYRSKTGMGRGLIGIKRLSERCSINPGPPGTRIEAEVHL